MTVKELKKFMNCFVTLMINGVEYDGELTQDLDEKFDDYKVEYITQEYGDIYLYIKG